MDAWGTDMVMGSSRSDRSFIPATVLLLCLVLVPLSAPVTSAEPLSITTFGGGVDDVTLTFMDGAANASAAIEVPRGATVNSASMDIEGIGGYEEVVSTLTFAQWDISSPHRAWKGWVQGNYPPSYPYWDPYHPGGTDLTRMEYPLIGNADDTRLATLTGHDASGRYPYHLFRFTVPSGNLTGIAIRWEGYGQCLASQTEGGGEMFVWKPTTETWARVDFYSQAGAGQERLLRKSWVGPHTSYVDAWDQVFVLVLGNPSQSTGGANPVIMDGELHTDHILVNATLEGEWVEASDVTLTVAPAGEVWRRGGTFNGSTRVSTGLKEALQAAIDAETVLPSNITVPLTVTFPSVTSASIRLSNLTVVYEPVVNRAPTWTQVPALEMYEDQDAPGLLDLDLVTEDDWSNTTLQYSVVYASTDAIEAVVDTGHYLSFHTREADWFGRATFHVNATDPWGENTTSPTIVLDVIGINDPPRASNPGRQQGEQGVPFHYRVEAHDVDGDPFTFGINTEVFEIDNATGDIAFTPTNEQVGLHRVTVSVTDDRGGETLVWMELTIANVNDPPVIEEPGILHGSQGVYFSHTFVVDDPDVMHGDILRWSLEGDPMVLDRLEFSSVLGELVWRKPWNEDVGQHTFVVRVEDGQPVEDTVSVIIVIANVNDPPQIAHIADIVMYEDGRLTQAILVSDPDVGVDPDERLTFRVEPPMFDVAEDGSYTLVATHEDIGVHQLTFTVTDRSGASHSLSFLLTVWALNHPPHIDTIADQVVNEDVEWTIEIVISDPDIGDEVRVTARGAPFPVPGEGGVIRWTPQERHGGEHLVTLTANDGKGGVTTLSFNLTVITYNDPPTVEIKSPRPNEVLARGEVFLISIGLDEEGDHLTYVWWWQYADTPDSQWEKITTGPSGQWTDPPRGKLRIKVEVTDPGGVGSDEVVIEVEATPPEGEGPVLMVAGGAALAVVAILVWLFSTGRLGARVKAPAPGPEEEVWEGVDPGEGLPPLHRGGP
jgi:hypothetical protein